LSQVNNFTAANNITVTTSPGAGINKVAYVKADYSPSVGETAVACYGHFINSGSTTPGSGEHLIGSLGRAEDTASGKFTLYGHESRVDAAGTAPGYAAQFNFALFGGASFGSTLYGEITRSEIYTDNTYTTPLAAGYNIGSMIAKLVGGASQRSIVAYDEVQIQAPIGAYNTAGSQSVKISHDGDSGFISVSGGTGGHLKIEPATGAYAILSTGAGLVPVTSGMDLGVSTNRWEIFGTSGNFSSTLVASNLSGTNTGDQTITLTGDITGSGTGSFATTIAANAVMNVDLADVPTATFKGRTTAGTGDPEDLTVTQATAMLNTFTSGLKGLVPSSGGGTTNFLRADGTFAAPPGGGSSSSASDRYLFLTTI
jgi:hypothetical protein